MNRLQRNFPDRKGHFGLYGGRFIPETLMPALFELEDFYQKTRKDKEFQAEFQYYLKQYVGRPTPLYFASKLSKRLKGSRIYLKREDLIHTGAAGAALSGIAHRVMGDVGPQFRVTDGRDLAKGLHGLEHVLHIAARTVIAAKANSNAGLQQILVRRNATLELEIAVVVQHYA